MKRPSSIVPSEDVAIAAHLTARYLFRSTILAVLAATFLPVRFRFLAKDEENSGVSRIIGGYIPRTHRPIAVRAPDAHGSGANIHTSPSSCLVPQAHVCVYVARGACTCLPVYGIARTRIRVRSLSISRYIFRTWRVFREGYIFVTERREFREGARRGDAVSLFASFACSPCAWYPLGRASGNVIKTLEWHSRCI